MLGRIETDCDLAGADAARLIALLPEAAAALADSAAEMARPEVPAASALDCRAMAELTVNFALAATGLALFGRAPDAAGQRAAPAPGGAAAQLARARGWPSPLVRRPPCPGSMPCAPTSPAPAPRQCTPRRTLPRLVDGDAHRSPGRIRAAGAMRSPRPADRAARRSRTFLRAGFFPRPRPGERRRAVFPAASPGADPPVPGMQGLGRSSGTLRRLTAAADSRGSRTPVRHLLQRPCHGLRRGRPAHHLARRPGTRSAGETGPVATIGMSDRGAAARQHRPADVRIVGLAFRSSAPQAKPGSRAPDNAVRRPPRPLLRPAAGLPRRHFRPICCLCLRAEAPGSKLRRNSSHDEKCAQ